MAGQYLAASNRHIDEHLLYWKHQQALINDADRDLKEAIRKVKRDNQLLAEIKRKTVEMAEGLAAKQQKELLASNLAEVPEPKPDLRRPTIPQGLRSKLDFKRGQLSLPRFRGINNNANARAFPANLQAASVGTHTIATSGSHSARVHTHLSATLGPSRSGTPSVPFTMSMTPADANSPTASNSSVSSPKRTQLPPPGPTNSDMGCKLRESMGL